MAVNLVTITGNLETLAGGTPYLGRLWFRLNRADWNGTGQIFAPEYIEATGDPTTGAFSVALQSTDDLEAGSYYTAILRYREVLDGKDREYIIAPFSVPTGGPHLLADLFIADTAAAWPTNLNYATMADFIYAVNSGFSMTDGHAVIVAGISYIADSASAIAGIPAGWKPNGNVTPEHFGAIGDDVADDRPAFLALEAYGVSPVYLTKQYYVSTYPDTRVVTYKLNKNASVRLNSGTWFPRAWVRDSESPSINKYNPLALDDSPTIVGAEYPLSTTALSQYAKVTNEWGKQHVDLNDTTKGRTGINMSLQQFAHYGEGDMYGIYYGGTIYRHARHASITHVRGQNNGGFGGGQMNAGTDQVTLYGWGDEVLKDRGFSNVALRGRVLMLYADGTDTYGYTVDRFGQFIMSRGANNIDGAYIAAGKMRTGLDLSKVVTSDNSAINMASGQKIWFDTSGAAVTTGYVANALGSYSIGKNSTLNQIDILANSGALLVSGSNLRYIPSSDQQNAIRAYGVTSATTYAALGVAGSVSYLTAGDDAATTTTLSLRTALLGVESDSVVVTPTSTNIYGTSDAINILKVRGETANEYLSMGQSGSVSYISAVSDASANTTLSLRTSAAGVESDAVIIGPGGTVNIAKAGAQLQFAGTKVIGARATGWNVMTGTPNISATYDTSTVTLAELAGRVMALQAALTTHGLIGA